MFKDKIDQFTTKTKNLADHFNKNNNELLGNTLYLKSEVERVDDELQRNKVNLVDDIPPGAKKGQLYFKRK